jgi:hypothetical protein
MNVKENSFGVLLGDVAQQDRNESQHESTFYDTSNPLLAPAKETTPKKKNWRRRLLVWSFVAMLSVGGGFVLYTLLKIKHVDVKVLAANRREASSAKPEPSPTSSESGLSAEAINIARQAIGPDAAATPALSPTTSSNPSPTPSPDGAVPRTLSFTDNSPAFAHSAEPVSVPANSDQSSVTENSQASQPAGPGLQARANTTQTLFVENLLPPPAKVQQTSLNQNQSRLEKKGPAANTPKATPAAVLPLFGTLLPVRTQGVIFSLRNNSYARLELARDCKGEGWSLSKGTLVIGRVSGSEYDRAFVTILGYIDPKTNRFVKMSGEVLGSDGGSGMEGKRVVVDRNRLKQTLSKVASSGLQVAGMMAGALTGRGTVVLNGAGDRVLTPITDETGRILNASDAKRSFVKVEAGQPAYVMVVDLPKDLHAVDAPGEKDFAQAATSLTDREVMELILFGTPDDIRAALPLMNDEQKRLVVKSTGTER